MGHFDTDVSKLQSDLEEFYRVDLSDPRAIDALNRSCYAARGPGHAQWNGRELWEIYRRAARQAKKDERASHSAEPLPALYPAR